MSEPVAASSRVTDRLARVALAPLRLVERTRGRRRVALLFLYAIVLAVAGLGVWWLGSLRGLPDIGDPFDVGAYRVAPDVPVDDDAMPLYRRAVGLYTRHLPPPLAIPWGAPNATAWTALAPGARAWFESHREALDAWRAATERPGLRAGTPGRPLVADDAVAVHWACDEFAELAMLEAARREAEGDFEGAWGWYAAILRAHRHMAAVGSPWERALPPVFLSRIVNWASDPGVDAPLLRRALAQAKEIDATIAPFSHWLKGHYLDIMQILDQIRDFPRQGSPSEERWYEFLPMYPEAARFLRREPERSRRVVRLIFANLLASIDEPLATRPPMVAPGVFDVPADPTGRDPSRRLSPVELAARAEESVFAPLLLDGQMFLRWSNADRRGRAAILLELGRQLYRREHGGAPPPDDRALVGTYLDRLPAGADEATPR